MAKAKSVDEYLRIVFKKIDEKSRMNKNELFDLFWFRGESCKFKKTSLIPGAYRNIITINDDGMDNHEFKSHSCFAYETNSKADFDRKALPYIISKKIENTAWNRYFLMQHYKVKTRLLDWTEDAIKALYMAINDNTKDEDNKDYDAKVWILNPFNLNLFTMGKLTDKELKDAVIPPLSNDFDKPQNLLDEKEAIRLEELTRRYLTMDFKKNEDYYPLAIYPPFLDERMAAQKACFTIFGDECKSVGLHTIQKDTTNIIDYVTIDGASKEKMLKKLRLIGIDESSVYPDLDGLGKSINDSYK